MYYRLTDEETEEWGGIKFYKTGAADMRDKASQVLSAYITDNKYKDQLLKEAREEIERLKGNGN